MINEVFYQSRTQRNQALTAILMWTAMGLSFPLFGAAHDDQAGFFFMACFGLGMLVAYWRYVLIISEDRVFQRSMIFLCQEIKLDGVAEVLWRCTPSDGSIILKAASQEVQISLYVFEREQRLRLIRFFRNKLPHVIQKDWPLFCYKIALPLRDPPRKDREPREDEILVTRRRWDWYFLPTMVLSFVLGVVLWQTYGTPHLLFAPLAITPLWLIMRWVTPRRGEITKRFVLKQRGKPMSPEYIEKTKQAAEEWDRQEMAIC